MKFWKKQIFSLLAALAVLLTLVPQRAEAASCGLSGAGSVRAGNTVTVTFSISGGDILGFEADLSYDSSQLSLEGSKSLLGSSWTVKMNGSRIVGYDSEQSNPINGSKQVMAFTFRVKSGASAGSSLSAAVSDVSVSYIRSSDGNAVTRAPPAGARQSPRRCPPTRTSRPFPAPTQSSPRRFPQERRSTA